MFAQRMTNCIVQSYDLIATLLIYLIISGSLFNEQSRSKNVQNSFVKYLRNLAASR